MTHRILVVEDDPQLRKILQMVLTDEGFGVDLAPNGQAALDHLEACKTNGQLPSMIILDLTMPVVDGWEVARRVDADPALRDIPLIVTSATQEQGESAKALHADAYLVKPFSTDEILGVVELFSFLG
ncbi:MAG TPA: response regulator [Aggregatilineales bacterium]|nr:response regulator [Aggregatilineales bacterium]